MADSNAKPKSKTSKEQADRKVEANYPVFVYHHPLYWCKKSLPTNETSGKTLKEIVKVISEVAENNNDSGTTFLGSLIERFEEVCEQDDLSRNKRRTMVFLLQNLLAYRSTVVGSGPFRYRDHRDNQLCEISRDHKSFVLVDLLKGSVTSAIAKIRKKGGTTEEDQSPPNVRKEATKQDVNILPQKVEAYQYVQGSPRKKKKRKHQQRSPSSPGRKPGKKIPSYVLYENNMLELVDDRYIENTGVKPSIWMEKGVKPNGDERFTAISDRETLNKLRKRTPENSEKWNLRDPQPKMQKNWATRQTIFNNSKRVARDSNFVGVPPLQPTDQCPPGMIYELNEYQMLLTYYGEGTPGGTPPRSPSPAEGE